MEIVLVIFSEGAIKYSEFFLNSLPSFSSTYCSKCILIHCNFMIYKFTNKRYGTKSIHVIPSMTDHTKIFMEQ